MTDMARIRRLPVVADPRGNLTFMEEESQIPFIIYRTSWLHDLRTRGPLGERPVYGPALIVALSGSCEVWCAEGGHRLIDASRAVLVKCEERVTIDQVSTNAVILIVDGRPEAGNGGERVPTPVPARSHAYTRLDDARIIELETCDSPEGRLRETSLTDTPLSPLRLFYLYDVPAGSTRGGHSHIRAHEVMTAAAGSFDVTLTDGHETRTYHLNDPRQGLYIPPGLWRTIEGFSSGAVCLVLTTELYSEKDYVRDYKRFKRLTKNKIDR